MKLLLVWTVLLGLMANSLCKSVDMEQVLEALRNLEDETEKEDTRALGKRGATVMAYNAAGKGKGIKFQKACLKAHNDLRVKHGAKPLKWSKSLAAAAEKWAQQVAKNGAISHSPESKTMVGENVANKNLPFKGVWGPAYLIFMWYSEYWNPGYNFKNPESDSNKNAGHFTQMVWKETKYLGCGVSEAPMGAGTNTFLVCQYDPKANMQGAYGANVMDLVGGAKLPKHPLDIALEGCCDYSDACSDAQKFCTAHKFVQEACCATCNAAR